MDEIHERLMRLELGFWGAAGDPNGGGYYQENMADDGLMILPFDGGMMNKQAVLPTISSSKPWKNYEIIEPKTIPLSGEVMALVYEVKASHGDDAYHAYITSTYINRGDKWSMLVHQQTAL